MKNLAISLLCLFGILCVKPMHADNYPDRPLGYTTVTTAGQTPNRPNAPSRLTLGCEYGPGYVNFIFPPYFDSVTFELIQNGSVVFSDREDKKYPGAA